MDTEIAVSESDLFYMVQEPNNKLVSVYIHEEVFQVELINPGKILLLWAYPPNKIDEYDFCPDQRTLTYQLLGKPALGPSPPSLQLCTIYNSGFVYSRLHQN